MNIQDYVYTTSFVSFQCKEISTDCKHSIMPDVHDGESCWEAICKDEHNEAERVRM